MYELRFTARTVSYAISRHANIEDAVAARLRLPAKKRGQVVIVDAAGDVSAVEHPQFLPFARAETRAWRAIDARRMRARVRGGDLLE